MKTVCITGAFGFIGRNTAKYFAAKGWHITGIGHGTWGRAEWRNWGLADWHATDITLDSLVTYAGKPDAIIHCAGSGSVSFSMDHPFQDFQRTVDTTAAVLEFIRIYNPSSRIVNLSSAGVYGSTNIIPIKESSELKPISPYGVHKKMAEDLCLSYAKHHGIKVSILRFFSIFGNSLRKQLLWDACLKLQNNETSFFGSGNEIRDWLHINDAVSLIYAAADSASNDAPIINGGSGEGLAVREILEELFLCFNRTDAPKFSGTARAGDPIHYVADISKAKRIGWTPKTSWKDGVKSYVKWFKDGAN